MTMKILSVVVLCVSLSAIGCGANSSAQSNNRAAVNDSRNAADNSKINSKIETPELTSEQLPMILTGSFLLRDARKNLQTTVSVDLRGEDVAATARRGVEMTFPPVGAPVKMDVMNCAGYLAAAEVKFHGREKVTDVWTAELIADSKIPDLEEKLLQCVENPKDEFARKYLSNSIYFIAPADAKRRQTVNVKNPDWKTILPTVPDEWRKAAKLSGAPTERQIEDCIGGWLDSDGDGAIDVLTLCAFNEKSVTENGSVYQYSRILKLTDGKWREIWETANTKD